MIYKEKEFYSRLLEVIKVDMDQKGFKVNDLLDNEYFISKSQYYNIKRISNGNNKISRLSHKRLYQICDSLGIKIENILYEIED